MDRYQRERFGDYYHSFLGGRLFRWQDKAQIAGIASIISSLPSTKSILDIGCGSGSIAQNLKMKYPNPAVYGIDIEWKLLQSARKRGFIVVAADFDHQLPFQDERFDVVIMTATIEHVRSREHIFTEVKRILRHDGVFIVTTPPYDSLTWLIGEWLFKLITGRKTDHISPFNHESLTWLLSSNFKEYGVRDINASLSMLGWGKTKIPTPSGVRIRKMKKRAYHRVNQRINDQVSSL